MYTTLIKLLLKLDDPIINNTSVIKWGSPIPSFGEIEFSRVASLGLNPSNREFVNNSGDELIGANRRFHTLHSLGIQSWSDADVDHIQKIKERCNLYFHINPYDIWFKKLNQIIKATGYSYYGINKKACHLDIIPYATVSKWTDISKKEIDELISITGDALAQLIYHSNIKLLILNGTSVIKYFEKISSISLNRTLVPNWTLPRNNNSGIKGYAYEGEIYKLSGLNLDRSIKILGFNHNIQSSFGVTKKVINAICDWVGWKSKTEVFHEM